jgi:hypothetical protein
MASNVLVFENDLQVKPAPASGDYEVSFKTMYGIQKGFFRVRAGKNYKYVAKRIKESDAKKLKKYTPKKYLSWLSGNWINVE